MGGPLVSRRVAHVLAFGCLGLFGLNTFGGVELTSWRAQALGQLVLWAVAPAALLGLAATIVHRGLRVSLVILASLVCVVCFVGVGASLLIDGVPHGDIDPSFQPVSRTAIGPSTLVLYRTNCGAPCSFGLVLQQEWRLVPGVKVARRLGDWYPADTAALRAIDSHTLRVDIPPYGYRHTERRSETVRMWRYPFLK